MKTLFAPASRSAWAPAAALTAWMVTTCPASIVGPYSPDSHTLHLWHMNETTVPVVDAVASGGTNLTALQNGATLGNASFGGFGTALNTYGPGPNYAGASSLAPRPLPNANTTLAYADPVTGAFTYEALVQITYDPKTNLGATSSGGTGRNTPLTILSGEGNSNGARLFTFRLDPVGFNPNAGGYTAPLSEPMLEFINLNKAVAVQNLLVPVPTSGADAIALNGWYHVAVTYSGQPNTTDNLKFYWTRLDSNYTSANLIGSGTMTLSLATGVAPNLVIGNTGRGPSGSTTAPVNANFLGLIDEVRMSKVARSAGQMMFAAPAITLEVDLTNQVTVLGQSVSFAVSAAGVPPLYYQWRHNGVNLLNATQPVYTIPTVTAQHAGTYDVVITNAASAVTSSTASLTLRTPLSLAWVGYGYEWDAAISPAWVDPNFASTVYTEGDNVTFDNQGAAFAQVSLPGPVQPSAVVVNADSDYTFSTAGNGGIFGITGLTKQGAGTLILDLNNGYSGPTRIQGGILQIGAGAARGSLGTGPITNNAGLVFNRTDALTVNNRIAGTGGLTNSGSGTVTLQGTNSYSGTTAANAGALVLAGSQALGISTNVILTASPGLPGITGTRLGLTGGVTTSTNVALHLLGSFSAPDLRCNLYTDTGTNAWNGPILLDNGDGVLALAANASNAQLQVNGPITSPGFMGKLTLRGNAGQGHLAGPVLLPLGQVNKTDNSVWTISSTGNAWVSSDVAGGTLRLGADNALPGDVTVNLLGGNLDLAGFNQRIGGLNGANAGSVIGSSSTSADCVLTLSSSGGWTNGSILQDSLSGGTRKVGLSLIGGALTLTRANPYSGPTLVSSGTLALAGAGAIANSSPLYLGPGATLDVSGRTDAGLTLEAHQVLQGDGTFLVLGNLTNAGTIEFKATKSGAVLVCDQLQCSAQLTYGGTLKLSCSGNALAAGDTLKLFHAAGYAGAFATISPASPGPGLAWYTGTLATDGSLRVIPLPLVSSTATVGATMAISGAGGPPGFTYVVVTTASSITNPAALWAPIQTNTFDANGQFTFTVSLRTNLAKQFFRIKIP